MNRSRHFIVLTAAMATVAWAAACGDGGTEPSAVSVGSSVTLDSRAGSAPEGGVVTLGLTVDPVPESAISVRYALGTDDDPVTADADGSDYADGGGGAVEIAAGASGAAIEIAINDDDEIESVREVFTVTLDTPGADAGYGLGVVASAAVTIEEGVCDRTRQVGDEIVQQAGVGGCAQVEDRHLASIQVLALCLPKYEWMECAREDDPITALREGDFLGLSGLTELDLSANELTELPAGVFSGLSNLVNLPLFDNRLTELPAGAFSGLSSLWNIGLDRNRLTELPAGIFSGLSRLNILDLPRKRLDRVARRGVLRPRQPAIPGLGRKRTHRVAGGGVLRPRQPERTQFGGQPGLSVYADGGGDPNRWRRRNVAGPSDTGVQRRRGRPVRDGDPVVRAGRYAIVPPHIVCGGCHGGHGGHADVRWFWHGGLGCLRPGTDRV